MATGDVFKALGDPTRRRILEMLADNGEMTAGDIAAQFSISAPSVSHHLSTLKQAGLVQDMRRGQSILYSLNMTVFQEMMKWIFDVMKEGEKHE